MKRKLMVAAVLICCFAVSAWGQQSQMRMLSGFVLDDADRPIPNAIVYLKNTKTLTIKTFIAEQDGGYRFQALSPNVDYEVYAELNGRRSDTKTLSSFDSRPQPRINLKIK